MTARSKKRRMKNARIKREKNKVKELNMLKKVVYGKNAKELMEVCEDLVDEKTVEEIKKVSKMSSLILVENLTKINKIPFDIHKTFIPYTSRNKQKS